MQLKDVMTPNPECIPPDATLQDAARKMRDLDVGAMPICGDDDRLAGMITDRDITVRAVAEGKDPRATPVREAMTEEVVYGFEDQDVGDAARVMEQKQIRRLLILDRNKRLVGIVSLGDLAVEGDDRSKAGEVLQGVSEPAGRRP
jgi:CBS domain-containing protein